MRPLGVVLLLVFSAAAVAAGGNSTPGDDEVSDQAWYLGKDKYHGPDDPHGKNNYQMSQAVPDTKQITINKGTAYFVSAEAATGDRGFGRLTWDLILWCNADDPVSWSMGYWHEGAFHGGGGETVIDCPAGQSETDYTRVDSRYAPPQPIFIPEGAFLALAISEPLGNMKVHVGEGQSRLVPAADAPDYDGPEPVVTLRGVVGPDDDNPIATYLYPSAFPGDDVDALYWIQLDVAQAAIRAVRFDVAPMSHTDGFVLPTGGSLRVELQDDAGTTVASGMFDGPSITLHGDFLGTYHARLHYEQIGAGPNRILPAGAYVGPITITASVNEPLHLLSDGVLSGMGPDAPGTAVQLQPGAVTTFATNSITTARGTWDLAMRAASESSGDVTTRLLHRDAIGNEQVLAQGTGRVEATLAEIGGQLTTDHDTDDGELVLEVTWDASATMPLTLWMHAHNDVPARLSPPPAAS